ncbi:MAG: peptide-methionine (S)-S-oxide reductase MsrA [Mariprofundaceae bacterium]
MKTILLMCIGGVLLMITTQVSAATAVKTEKATFAGGCFWCMQHPFDELPGVISTTVGYTGGKEEHPKYAQVSAGDTGHTEAVQVLFDPMQINYAQLLDVYWRNTDPTTPNRQFCDVGKQYRPAIFYHNESQKKLAEASKTRLQKTKSFLKNIITEITPANTFWIGEEYHQNYYINNPIRYKYYRFGCGRDNRLKQLWESTND